MYRVIITSIMAMYFLSVFGKCAFSDVVQNRENLKGLPGLMIHVEINAEIENCAPAQSEIQKYLETKFGNSGIDSALK